jgi:SOS response regulatory protein OraA/RecX
MTMSRRRSRGFGAGSTPGSGAGREPERWSRNDPERPIGYDPEKWAGLDPEPGDPGGAQRADGDPAEQLALEAEWWPGQPEPGSAASTQAEPQSDSELEPESARPGSSDRETRRRRRNAERRAERPKKPRAERSPQERNQRTADRKARAADAVAANPTAAAKSIVLRQLTMGARTRAQLRQAMARKDIPDDVATAVLDRFEEVELVDDKEFSRQWVQSRHLGRGLARRALAYELRQRGVAEETVRDAVEEVTPDDELAAARELVRRKAVTMRNDDPQRRVRRLAGMLARKGYGGGVAMQAIREELADLADLADEADLGRSDDGDADLD